VAKGSMSTTANTHENATARAVIALMGA